jgi:hypothetical protein
MARESFVRSGAKRVMDLVGPGHLVGKLVVDQVYAKYHHERMDLKHPRGGGPKYLEGPLLADASQYLQKLAKHVLDGELVHAMAECMEGLNGRMSRLAPVEFNNLRRSGNPRVYDHGRLVYNRPAHQRRLSDQELKALRKGRRR